jgi:hypothetical protein
MHAAVLAGIRFARRALDATEDKNLVTSVRQTATDLFYTGLETSVPRRHSTRANHRYPHLCALPSPCAYWQGRTKLSI